MKLLLSDSFVVPGEELKILVKGLAEDLKPNRQGSAERLHVSFQKNEPGWQEISIPISGITIHDRNSPINAGLARITLHEPGEYDIYLMQEGSILAQEDVLVIGDEINELLAGLEKDKFIIDDKITVDQTNIASLIEGRWKSYFEDVSIEVPSQIDFFCIDNLVSNSDVNYSPQYAILGWVLDQVFRLAYHYLITGGTLMIEPFMGPEMNLVLSFGLRSNFDEVFPEKAPELFERIMHTLKSENHEVNIDWKLLLGSANLVLKVHETHNIPTISDRLNSSKIIEKGIKNVKKNRGKKNRYKKDQDNNRTLNA